MTSLSKVSQEDFLQVSAVCFRKKSFQLRFRADASGDVEFLQVSIDCRSVQKKSRILMKDPATVNCVQGEKKLIVESISRKSGIFLACIGLWRCLGAREKKKSKCYEESPQNENWPIFGRGISISRFDYRFGCCLIRCSDFGSDFTT